MDINVRELLTRTVGFFLLFGLALFVPAGNVRWVAGWIYLILYFGFVTAITAWLFGYDRELLKERMTVFTPDQKVWDRALMQLVGILFIVWILLMPLDAVRFRWSHMPPWLQMVGAAFLVCSFYIFYLAMRTNPYLSPVVRIQEDRSQRVVNTGPYRYVRHPMYSGAIFFIEGTALLLGSWYGLFFGLTLVCVIARRAMLEEETLRSELEGYNAYMGRVRYRLIPGIW
jgi:protein-S-isoprenylcysteine O-methyltransferase Ste14